MILDSWYTSNTCFLYWTTQTCHCAEHAHWVLCIFGNACDVRRAMTPALHMILLASVHTFITFAQSIVTDNLSLVYPVLWTPVYSDQFPYRPYCNINLRLQLVRIHTHVQPHRSTRRRYTRKHYLGKYPSQRKTGAGDKCTGFFINKHH